MKDTIHEFSDEMLAGMSSSVDELSRYSIPLYLVKPEHLRYEGTGFLIGVSGRVFLVSNGHVLDNAKKSGVGFFLRNGLIYLIGGAIHSTSAELPRHEDNFDVAVVEVRNSPDLDLTRVIDLSRLASTADLNYVGHFYALIGYPASKVKRTGSGWFDLQPFTYFFNPLERSQYAKLQVGKVSSNTLCFHFNTGRLRRMLDHRSGPKGARAMESPSGMSGSPIWITKGSPESSNWSIAAVFFKHSRHHVGYATSSAAIVSLMHRALLDGALVPSEQA